MTTRGRGERLQTPSAVEAARGLGMVYGGPVLVAAWWAGSAVSAAATLLGRRRGRIGAITAAGLLAPALYYLLLRPRWQSWGATRGETAEALPGDNAVPNPAGTSTRAITIDASAEEVWQWLVQMGHGGGGWYGDDLLETAAGAGAAREGHSTPRAHPQLQALAPGDLVQMSPWTALRVTSVDAPRAMVLESEGKPSILMPRSSWAFVLKPVGPSRTRLIVRGRVGTSPRDLLESVSAHLVETPHFIMERSMMLGLKRRAEHAWRARWQPWRIDRVLPDAEFQDEIAVVVKAPGERILRAIQEVTVADVPAGRLLGGLRHLPGRLRGRLSIDVDPSEPFVDALSRRGWVTVADDVGREVVWGGAAKYHRVLDQQPRFFSRADEFAAFDEPECQKMAISVRVEPGPSADARRVVLEHRTKALGDEARRQFAWYWRLLKPAAALAARRLLLAAKRRAESA